MGVSFTFCFALKSFVDKLTESAAGQASFRNWVVKSFGSSRSCGLLGRAALLKARHTSPSFEVVSIITSDFEGTGID